MTYSFKARFADQIISGEKRSTIRKTRIDGKVPKPGEILHLFTGMRTKQCRFLRDVRCTSVSHVFIDVPLIKIEGRLATPAEVEQIAKTDGFRDSMELFDTLQSMHEMPLIGNLIEWDPNLSTSSTPYTKSI